MDVVVEEKGEIIIMRVKGRLDAASSPQLEQTINSIIDGGHFKLVLNFSDVEYLSSAGMRLMLAISKKLQNLEGKVVACSLSEDVMEVIKMAGFNQVIEFYPSEQESLAHL
ncbi:MAG: putative anti-sigma factor antagonist BtrV [Chlamydiales bacterium]|nr:putative anti-sigma factor antagonist BtrV [Chlamydiales bacterium]MCH9635388.1 putative anti-sigma factor antagonist BtrV [Chlamydiales bacterium]MCH9704342.1 STAS domain-containing protein [Chlamydiota bacterium]